MRKLIIVFVFLTSLFLVGCSQYGTDEADISDKTVFTPPEQEDKLTGSWSTTADTVNINRFFYGNGQLVTIMQDVEEDTWCYLGTWKEEDTKITFETEEAYKYNNDSGEWEKTDEEATSLDVIQESDDKIVDKEYLPNGIIVDATYERGIKTIEIPDETAINLIINDFLIH